MSESNVPEIIKYLTEDNLKLMYSRLNRRYLVVDALPSVDSLEPADKNVIYVVKETVGETVRYWPNVLDNDTWKPFGIGQADLDGKADKVDAVEGHLVVSDGNGDLADADIMPGTFVALAIDPSESIQPHATDLRKIWKAYQSGMPVALLDNRPGGTGLYAQLNAAGYTWADGDRMAECLEDVDDGNRHCDGTVHGYRTERDGVVKFYEDAGHTVEIVPENGKLYCDDTVPDRDRVYLYNDGFVRALRFVQFSCNELLDDDPAWPSRRANRQVFYRMTEPYGSSSPDGFEVAYGESTADIHDQMVTGARIGKGKLLPVDDGVIVFPKSASVNDGTLTITVGENEPVVFSANDSADRAVDIPVATGEVAGLVRITSDVASDDPGAAITATAVLGELDSYVQKVGGATAGHIAALTPEGSVSDSGISSTDVESAVGHDHTHGNKSILDGVTAPYTTEEQAKLAGIEARAQVNTIESISVNGTAVKPEANKNVAISIPKAVSDPSAANQMLFSTDGATWVTMTWEMEVFNANDIGGRTYRTVTIGNQIWLAENLDYKFDYNGSELPVGVNGSPSTPAAWYYTNEETYGIDGIRKCGLMYNWYAAKYLDDNKATLLPPGWHVPTKAEWVTLANTVAESNVGSFLKALDNATGDWPTGWNGNDEYGFGVLPGGTRLNIGVSYDVDESITYWTKEEYGTDGHTAGFTKNSNMVYGSGAKENGCYIRLVKDA